MALMGLCHSLVEDTILMMLLGGHLSGILGGRVVFSYEERFSPFLLTALALLAAEMLLGVTWLRRAP